MGTQNFEKFIGVNSSVPSASGSAMQAKLQAFQRLTLANMCDSPRAGLLSGIGVKPQYPEQDQVELNQEGMTTTNKSRLCDFMTFNHSINK